MTRINTEVKLDKNSTNKIRNVKVPVEGFMKFMNRYSVITMALGVIIGQATKDTVNSLVSGIISPLIQLLTPDTQLEEITITIKNSELQIGLFLSSLLEMLIIMVLLYIFFGVILKRSDLLETRTRRLPKKSKKKAK